MTPDRFVRIAHVTEGRIRLRLSWLKGAVEEAETIAGRLAELDGMTEVQVRPYTGSVLCRHDPDLLSAEDIVHAVQEHTAVRVVLQPGEEQPHEMGAALRRSSIASAVRADLRQATNGSLDLGTLAALSFFGLGAAEIAITRQLPMPPWFNLAWWAFRTFTMFEREAPYPTGAPAAKPARARGRARRKRHPRRSPQPPG
jgi:hypothetical protein